ncbi:MAG: hypothetical protein LBV63_04950 [Candidatus Methanoplasma sp.]|jgi:hypothetical protein|nr:hypothetical protein [Candidatus Methanoplasma sp.]
MPSRCPRCHSLEWQTSKDRSQHIGPDADDDDTTANILSMYEDGATCTKITISLGLSFDRVFRVLADKYRKGSVRI